MIVFKCTKKEFFKYVDEGIISNKIYGAYKSIYNSKTKISEIKSWARSIPYIKELIEALPENIGIAFEYELPLSSKRVDVILSGYDIKFRPVIILIELKGWKYLKVSENGLVITKIGKTEKKVVHPAYQVLSYTNILKSYNYNIEKYDMLVIPIVYLHNYKLDKDDILYDNRYKPYYKNVLMFGRDDIDDLRYFIENNLCFGDNLGIVNILDQSDINPNKNIVKVLESLINKKDENIFIDEQKEVLERIKELAGLAYKNKVVLIIKGGPGSGKTILAIYSLSLLLSKNFKGAYVTKNMDLRNFYIEKLNKLGNYSLIELFKSSGIFFSDYANKYDFLLIDEAHRLQEKSGFRCNKGNNQIQEIINASRFSVFFVDERQIVTLRDIGSIDLIRMHAKEADALIYESELFTQFRCNGNNYIEFVESLLDNKRNKPKFNFDFKVVDSPLVLHNLIKEKNTSNNARLVAGFCWKRKAKYADSQEYHDIVIDDFSISWNLKHASQFANRESAINEAGCIYNVQGLEFDYIGVIIGPDLIYRDGLVISDYKARASTEKSLYGLRVLMKDNKEYYEAIADTIIKNTYRVLLTRGLKGCYVYAVDNELQKYLKRVERNCRLE